MKITKGDFFKVLSILTLMMAIVNWSILGNKDFGLWCLGMAIWTRINSIDIK